MHHDDDWCIDSSSVCEPTGVHVDKSIDMIVVCASSDLDQAIRARGVRLRTFPFTRAITPWKTRGRSPNCTAFCERSGSTSWRCRRPRRLSSVRWRLGSPDLRASFIFCTATAYEGKRGLLGAMLRAATSLPCRLADVTFAVSSSVAERICADRLGKPHSIRVLGAGSANGVDLTRFSPNAVASSAHVRRAQRIPLEAVVIGFVGRLTRDKGVEDLARAFRILNEQWPRHCAHGRWGLRGSRSPGARDLRFLSTHPGVRHVGWQADVLPFMAAMNIVVLPTFARALATYCSKRLRWAFRRSRQTPRVRATPWSREKPDSRCR